MTETLTRLQDVQRRAVQQEIEAVALALFLERGYTETTIDDVSAAAGVSRRTIFRYFETKQDLVLASMRETGDRLAQSVRELPAQTGAWEALTRTLLAFAGELDVDQAAGRPRGRLLLDTPQLHAALALKHLEWRELLTEVALTRVSGPVSTRRLRTQAIVASALACLDVAATEWTRDDDGPTVRTRLQTVFQSLSRAVQAT